MSYAYIFTSALKQICIRYNVKVETDSVHCTVYSVLLHRKLTEVQNSRI